MVFRTTRILAVLVQKGALTHFDALARHRSTIESPVAGCVTSIRQSLPPGLSNFFMFVNVLSSSCALRGFDATITSKAPPSNPWLVNSLSTARVLKVILLFDTPKCSFASFKSPSVEAVKTYLGRLGVASEISGVDAKSDEASPPPAVPSSRTERSGQLCASNLKN